MKQHEYELIMARVRIKALEDDLRIAQGNTDAAITDYNAALERIKSLRVALEWYAERSHWDGDTFLEGDYGTCARRALSAREAEAGAVKLEPLPKDTSRFKRLSDADDGEYGAGLRGAREIASQKLASVASVSIPSASPASHVAEWWDGKPMPRGGVETDWEAASILQYRKYCKLAKAAAKVVEEADRIHDNEPWPVKYRAPWEAITGLRNVLATQAYHGAAPNPKEGDGND